VLGYQGMKTFLKIALISLVVLVAIKLLPVTLIALAIIAAVIAGALALGLSAAILIALIILACAAALSPIWVPVLAVVGVVALIRKASRKTA
jgi:hypothetical protein